MNPRSSLRHPCRGEEEEEERPAAAAAAADVLFLLFPRKSDDHHDATMLADEDATSRCRWWMCARAAAMEYARDGDYGG